MNTLQVTCKPKDREEPCEVSRIDFMRNHLEYFHIDYIGVFTKKFTDLEWIDFGTTRWYPNGK